MGDSNQMNAESQLQFCAFCLKAPDKHSTFKSCGKCKILKYCSKKCQGDHWPIHKMNCFSKEFPQGSLDSFPNRSLDLLRKWKDRNMRGLCILAQLITTRENSNSNILVTQVHCDETAPNPKKFQIYHNCTMPLSEVDRLFPSGVRGMSISGRCANFTKRKDGTPIRHADGTDFYFFLLIVTKKGSTKREDQYKNVSCILSGGVEPRHTDFEHLEIYVKAINDGFGDRID